MEQIKVISICLLMLKIAESGFIEDMKVYSTCRGESTGLGVEAALVATQNADCLLAAGKPKYCKYLCIAEQKKLVTSEGKSDFAQVEKYWRKIGKDFPGKEEVVHIAKDCAKDKIYKQENNCKNAREFVYCFHNKYTKICELKDVEDFDIRKESDESIVDKLLS